MFKLDQRTFGTGVTLPMRKQHAGNAVVAIWSWPDEGRLAAYQIHRNGTLPFDGRKVTGNGRRSYFALPVAAREADCSNFPLLGLLRYFVFANGQRTGDDRSLTQVTAVNREVKVFLLHWGGCPSVKKLLYRKG
jgi:hypothetical protein